MYTVNQVRVLWAGLASDYFAALNGVKQGGVISPILFCIFIDDLLNRLSSAGVGCYAGLDFAGALSYADDIVILAPTPTAIRQLLANCDSYASELDIVFNADKSKFLVVAPNKRRALYNFMCDCQFFIGGKPLENVKQYTHLGHIIRSTSLDTQDVIYRRNCFVGQTNNFLCFFNHLDFTAKLKLFKSYCSSMYGCELWALSDDCIELFCTAWRTGLRRVLNLPFNSHSFFLPVLSNTLPIVDELCKRSARFITSCLLSCNRLVRSISRHSVVFSKYNSLLGSNTLVCCSRYGWSSDSFLSNCIPLNNNFFEQWCLDNLTEIEINSIGSLLDILFIREGYSVLPVHFELSASQITDIMTNIVTN